MLKEAVAYYHSLLADRDLAGETARALLDGHEDRGLIFGGRPLSPYLRPHFITAESWDFVRSACETVWSALQKVKDRAVEDEALLDELGVTDIEKDLIRIDPGYTQVSPTSRLDSFLAGDSYSFVELNGESPAGIAYADTASEIFLELPAMRRFAERYSLRRFHGRPKMLDVLLACWDEFCGGTADRKPVIAIVDLKDLPTQHEF